MDYIIVDNFLESPKEIRKKALKNFKYFNKFNHPQDVGVFPGFRTNYLHLEDKELFPDLQKVSGIWRIEDFPTAGSPTKRS